MTAGFAVARATRSGGRPCGRPQARGAAEPRARILRSAATFCAPWARADHCGRDRLKNRAGRERWPVGAGPVANHADERRPEGERELIDPDDERDESGEALARPLHGENEAG